MFEQLFQQVIAGFIMPAFYVSVLATFIFGLGSGWVLKDLSLFAAIVLFLLGQAINSSSSLPHIIISGWCCVFALGMLIPYMPRWIDKTFFRPE